MVGVVVDYDLVTIPQPVVAKSNIVGSNAEVKTAKPEARRAAAFNPVDMAAANSTGEVSMFPGMVEMVVSIIRAAVMANPFSVGVNVGSFGMACLIGKGLVCGLRARIVHWRGAVGWNESASHAVSASVISLSKDWQCC